VFYEKLAASEQLPTTSQPTPVSFEEVYEEVTADGSQAVVITIAATLSGTYQSATIAAEDFSGKVFVVDSRNASIGAGILAQYALTLAERGMTGEQILEELIRARKQIRLCFLVDTLEYLKKGGRLNAAVAVVGGLLNIKPILQIEAPGEIRMLSTARGMKKAFSTLNDLSAKFGGPDTSRPMLLGYTGVGSENLEKYKAEAGSAWAAGISSTHIGSAIGVHVGPGAVAFAFFEAEK
jgi:DegV family protein with EDD domain